MLLIGYGIGLPLVIYSFYHSYRVAPNLDASLARMLVTPIDWTGLIYPFQRILLVMAHASAVILMYRRASCEACSTGSRPLDRWR